MDKEALFWPIQLEYMSKYIGLASFVIGTLFFTAYLTAPSDEVFRLGLLFVLGAVIVNSTMVFLLFIGAFLFKPYTQRLLKTALAILINIPIAISYVWILFN
ncbi:hypothetical protein [Spongiivirga citrea]|uniref:Uncharacterized protein n=1 Tax=Spongiivirga citrea TaxID=1481457 RepID=A0A6M0CQR0_9FLAO|nr:hypothetical protein [Spongiivirga citrea]NER16260.1 hypothetical protein [Spongiivirga citrea]